MLEMKNIETQNKFCSIALDGVTGPDLKLSAERLVLILVLKT